MADKNNGNQEEMLDKDIEEVTQEQETSEAEATDTETAENSVEDQSADSEEAANEEDKDEKKGLFGKKKEKKDKKQEQIDELNDKLKRSMAEFDNFRKRTEKEKSQMYEIGAKDVIDKILPVVDNFERAFQGLSEEDKKDPFISGMDMVYKQLMTAFEGLGVTPIEAVGVEFDPNLHNAVMQVASEEYESGVVAQELQKGYKYRESVVRHSMVAVVE